MGCYSLALPQCLAALFLGLWGCYGNRRPQMPGLSQFPLRLGISPNQMNPFWDNIDIFFFLSLSTYTISPKKKKPTPGPSSGMGIYLVSGFVGVRSLGASLYSVAMVFYGCLFNERAACNVGLSGIFFFSSMCWSFFFTSRFPPTCF